MKITECVLRHIVSFLAVLLCVAIHVAWFGNPYEGTVPTIVSGLVLAIVCAGINWASKLMDK